MIYTRAGEISHILIFENGPTPSDKQRCPLKAWLTSLKQATYNTTFMYNLRMVITFAGTAFVPYFMGFQLATIPLTLGAVAAGLSDIDDRFSVRIMNLIFTYIGFFITATSIYFLFPHPIFSR